MARRPASDRTPILVTGAPRSGTTWLARLLTDARRTALAGREPMNARSGGYGLAKTLDGWVRLSVPTPRQGRALRRAYTGRNPLCFGRYGRRQWAAPLPGTRVIVKDPFALLSMRAISSLTDARIVLLYRHPAAVLASYRRMGWTPDTDELRPVLEQGGEPHPMLPRPGECTPAEEFGAFWAALYTVALADVPHSNALVVSHEEVAGGGPGAVSALFGALGLDGAPRTERDVDSGGSRAPHVQKNRLHNFDRDPAAVAHQWREQIEPRDVEDVERTAGAVLARLDAGATPLT